MDSLLGNLPFAFVYLDDILVASTSAAEHCQHLAAVCSLLQDNDLVVNANKCMFSHSSMEFLGLDGIRPLPSSVQAIAKFPRPPSGSCRHSLACSIFTGVLFRRRHA
jgi:hypothetical protein